MSFLSKPKIKMNLTAAQKIAIIVAILFFVAYIPPSFATTLVTPDLPLGTSTISFRDIGVTSGFTPTFTINPSSFHLGNIVTMTVTDANANLNTTNTDTVIAKMGGSPIPLNETGLNAG